jgi:hypothetical protein
MVAICSADDIEKPLEACDAEKPEVTEIFTDLQLEYRIQTTTAITT